MPVPTPICDPELIERIYESVARQESTYDGIYYTGVHTTGIFCRPSCRARTPKRQNVSFYTSISDAMEAGFRPCKRCKPEAPGPDGPEAALAKSVKELIAQGLPSSLPLGTLAGMLHVSPFYLQRVFKRLEGASPAEYALRLRIEEAKRLLAEEAELTVAEVAGRTGFSSPAYFSTAFLKATGLSPTEFRLSAQLPKN